MKHHIIKLSLGLIIISATVGGLVYWQWPDVDLRPDRTDHSTSTADQVAAATSSLLESLPAPAVGPPPAEAAPAIKWIPASLSEILGQGQSKTVQVSFTASENASDVAVRVVPELQPFVQVNPTSFSSITRGQTLALDITFSASETAPLGTATGTIQLGTFARPLPVELEVWRQITLEGSGVEVISGLLTWAKARAYLLEVPVVIA
jgi:hypothetical protein